MIHRSSFRPSRGAVVVALVLAATGGAAPALHAADQSVTLGFASLPSAQGWTYLASGSHAGVPEATVFSVAGSVLTQNSIGLAAGVTGGSILYQALPGLITATEPKQTLVRARCLQIQGSASAPAGQGGLYYGFATGSVQYGFSLTPTGIYILQPSGTVGIPGAYDNTQFHDYFYEFTPPGTNRLYRDGVLVSTSVGGFALAANRIFLGDGTGGANAQAQTVRYQFVQGGATPAQAATWGRLKSVYR